MTEYSQILARLPYLPRLLVFLFAQEETLANVGGGKDTLETPSPEVLFSKN